eukprot:Protomagalhaensia_wolfi_Nauph_80__3562@NODE_3605_length_755_cov_17_131285_g2836_i0_p1_GENE_NODE_3605_length_755_cov_17_131285_g2836_i0NODE_3605_length_755_cov_17_131285_g2836_i0_p1_ORF_typecomplete_len161_score14_41BCIP/PF13862_6/0_00011_NODE_3605_length_755_cov_17_131285_g2836_i0214696
MVAIRSKPGGANLQGAVERGEVGLFLTEGISNIPASLLASCCATLLADIAWTLEQEDCPIEERQNWTALKKLVAVTFCYKGAMADLESEEQSHKKRARTGNTFIEHRHGIFGESVINLGSTTVEIPLSSSSSITEVMNLTLLDLQSLETLAQSANQFDRV